MRQEAKVRTSEVHTAFSVVASLFLVLVSQAATSFDEQKLYAKMRDLWEKKGAHEANLVTNTYTTMLELKYICLMSIFVSMS